MRYDLLCILPTTNEETYAPEIKENILKLLTSVNATIIREEDLGKRKLAYPIRSTKHGHYLDILFEAENDVATRLHQALTLNTDILRYQIVQEEQTAGKSTGLRRRFRSIRKMPLAAVLPGEESLGPGKVSLEELDKKLEEILAEEVK